MHRLLALPDAGGWALGALIFACFIGTALPFGLASGLLDWQPGMDGLLAVALMALFLPALGEEILFRGPLLFMPDRRILPLGGLLLALFVLWHPANALVLITGARTLFWDPRFLVIAAGLGLACTLATHLTRSLAPAVLIHWLTVIGWKGLFGGDRLLVP